MILRLFKRIALFLLNAIVIRHLVLVALPNQAFLKMLLSVVEMPV